MKAALFVPCYVDQFYPQVARATLKVLEMAGVEVHFPKEQTCCGQPMANAGFPGEAAPLAQKFLEVFAGDDYIVAPSGSCVSMVRNHYAGLLKDSPALKSLGGRTFELCEFLTDILKIKRWEGHFPRRVGLHASCHGLRELRLGAGSERRIEPFDKVRPLLSSLSGLTLVPLSRPDECCGFGGTFSVTEEAVSCSMGLDRIADHEKGGAEIIAGGDMSCLMHLEGLLRRDNKPMKVMHVAEILAESAAT